ncbi:ABC transporter substrate-binding protein [Halorussus sp. AFM4]|uniref:ABC transporter substrate-binding protein n=1 Tax=Halorussus sp. AFM4 TaxID=3421651 RepID=UPI003EC0DCAB
MVSSNDDQYRRREMLKYTGIGVGTTLIAGCAGQDNPDNRNSPTDQDTTTTQDSADDTQNQNNNQANLVTYIGSGEVATLDPAKHQFLQTSTLAVNLYDPLLFIDPKTQEPTAHVATDWSTSNNGTTWEFKLRDDVTFHNGDQLTAEDVAYSMDRLLGIGQGYSYLFNGIIKQGSTTAVDKRTVRFNLQQPFSVLPAALTRLFIVNKSAVKPKASGGDWGSGYLQKNVEGSGPYKLGRWQQASSQITLEAYDDHWRGWPDNRLDRVQWRLVNEVSTIKTMFQQGNAHAVHLFFPDTTKREIAKFDNVRMEKEVKKSTNAYYIFQHSQKKPLDDVNVRRAIAHAYDYETAINQILGGAPMAGPVPSSLAGHNDNLSPIKQDLEKAKAALEKSKYSLEEINSVTIQDSYDPSLPTNRKAALLLRNNLNKIGIKNVELVQDQFPALAEKVQSKETSPHMYHLFSPATIPSAFSFLNGLFLPSAFGTTNGGHWFSTDKLQSLLNDAVQAETTDKKQENWREAQKIIQNNYPSLNVAQMPVLMPMNESVKGWTYRGAMGYDIYFNDWHR